MKKLINNYKFFYFAQKPVIMGQVKTFDFNGIPYVKKKRVNNKGKCPKFC